ncbi:MAG: hypothetical protein VZQ98_07155 [Bacteroidales bacterium]|nr:hypothetical protein [Bacteroidales bacterium]
MLTGFPPKGRYKVLIKCCTYNQSKYITDALKGFVMQQTNFPFLAYVVDDASTDGEQEVIKGWINEHCNPNDVLEYDNEFAHIIMSKDKDNANCTYAIHLLKKNLYGKPEKMTIHNFWREQCEYEAICEGDDFWIDEKKLQKQVNIMDNNPNIGFVYTAFETANKDGEFTKYDWCEERMERSCSGDIFEKLIDHNMVLTLTICFRKTLYDKYLEFLKKYLVSIDYFLFLVLAGLSKGIYIDEKMGCYRINSNGLVQSSRERVNALCNKALIVSSKIYLNGDFFERSFKEDLKIRKAIVTKFLRLVKSNVMTKSEFFKIVSSSFKMICMLGVVSVEMLKKKVL